MPRSTKPMNRGTGLRAKSPRKVTEDAEMKPIAAQARNRDDNRCRAFGILPGPCDGVLDPHHRIQTSVRPDLRLEVSNVLTICRRHHTGSADSIHADEGRARTLDLLRMSWDWPDVVELEV